jgi:glutamate-ammonia-ligase adenylyltransferase
MTSATSNLITNEIDRIPEDLRQPVMRWLERLDEEPRLASKTGKQNRDLRILVRLVASSEFASNVLLRNWDWFNAALEQGVLDAPPDQNLLNEFVKDAGSADVDARHTKKRLRRFRNQQLLHILWRTTCDESDLQESLASLSNLADSLVKTSMAYAERSLAPRFGLPRNANGERIPLIVLAMGKLGGHELNFSSDIDLIFLYPEEGETDGKRKLSAHEYFTRISRLIVSLLDETTEDGFVYRVDTRLRPFGESGPPVVSFAALEVYLLQHGRGWERYAYVKARVISPGASAATIDELCKNMIEPFVYRRYLDYGVFESLRDMKALIAAEVRKRELAANIKLGPGGIREIEFIAQSLQLVRGGSDQQLRCSELQVVLPRLGEGRGLAAADVSTLLAAYTFFRRLENGIQAIRDQQTHELPVDPQDRSRLLLVMHYENWRALMADLDAHRLRVSELFAAVAFRTDNSPAQSQLAESLAALWSAAAPTDEWQLLLQQNDFADAGAIAASIVEFANAPVQRQIGATSRKRLRQFMPAFLMLLQARQSPAVICDRVLNVALRIVRRSSYVALLNENPAVLQRLVTLCEKSAYLAQEIAQFPLLLDEMLDPRLYSAKITAASMRDDLLERLDRSGSADSEQQIEILSQFQRATLFRIAVADFSGNLPIMKVSDRLTELAEIVLHQALDVAWTDLTGKHGIPCFTAERGLRTAGIGVIAYGKLGGMELSYRSDLDLVFLHNSSGAKQETNGAKPLENSMFFGRLVRRLVHFLTTQTSSGALYEVDTRLRPSGRSGLLVVSVEAFERYQEDNAWTWEHQALLRSRAVAGDAVIAREFERIRAETLRHRVRRDQLLDDVLSMRDKMRKQLDKSSDTLFDLKQGQGGLGDIEFLVQYVVLKNAEQHPAIIHYPDNIRQLGTLAAVGCLPIADVERLQQTYKAYRLCVHRLVLDDAPALVSGDRFVDERKFVHEIWQREMRE